jgi:Aldehyde dehydrogenase family
MRERSRWLDQVGRHYDGVLLTSSIVAGNTHRAFELAPKILAGIVSFNSPTVNDDIHAPMGGVRDSGCDRTGQDVIRINSMSSVAGPLLKLSSPPQLSLSRTEA